MPTKTFTTDGHSFTFRSTAAPMLRTDRLVTYLTTVGYDPKWMDENLKPLINRWEEPTTIFKTLKEQGFEKGDVKTLEKLLHNLFLNQVRDWYAHVQESGEEDTPARDLADSMDYWGEYAKKFGNALLKIRAVQHGGQMLFLVDDIAKVYGGEYEVQQPAEFQRKVIVPCSKYVKKYVLEKLTYREILAASPSAEKDKRGMQQGKWFVDEGTMLFVLQQSKKPSAMQFRRHLIDVLKGRAESMATFKAKKIEARNPEEMLEEDSHILSECRRISRDRGANPQAMMEQATVGYLGEKLEDFAERKGIKRPHRKNVIRELPDVGDGVSSSVRLGNHLTTNSETAEGDVLVGRAYFVAGALTRKTSEMDITQAEQLLASIG